MVQLYFWCDRKYFLNINIFLKVFECIFWNKCLISLIEKCPIFDELYHTFPANWTRIIFFFPRKSCIWQFSRKIRQMKADIFFNQLVVTKGLKIRRISIFIRMASLQRITSVRKVFQNPGSVARMMSNDTGRSEGKFTVYLSLLIKWHDISSLIWNFRCCPWSWWSFRKEREGTRRPVL